MSSHDLTTSAVARQNVLNNPYALAEVEKAAGIRGIPFEGTQVVLKEQVATFFGVTVRTVETHCAEHASELAQSGYAVITGNRLKTLKESIALANVPEIFFGNINRAPQLAVFSLRAFLNLAMLLSGSERARQLRSMILDVAIDTINMRSGGSTKYINQRDSDYLEHAFAGENYRKEFTDALKDYVDAGKWKYANITDKVYEIIFKEKSREYRRLLNLSEEDNTRRTFYSEVISLIAGFEHGIATALKSKSEQLGRTLSLIETDAVIAEVASTPMSKPLIEMARTKMSSRDFGLRGVEHPKLGEYITSLPPEEFEKFLGEQSKELAKQIEDAKEVMKRLAKR